MSTRKDEWIVVPGWEKFQHYTNRNPVWIKLYTELAKRDDWRRLTLAERGLLVCIWIEYAQARGQIRTSDLHARLGQRTTREQLESLKKARFIRFRASKPLAGRYTRERVSKETLSKKGLASPATNSGGDAPPPEEPPRDPDALTKLGKVRKEVFGAK